MWRKPFQFLGSLHKLPVYHGGTNDISNIQPECYRCNFEKNAGRLTREMNR
ncbi:HNH endonuclease signature motif containing protein [Bradyrhizobium sp. AZCC 2289]|uniref:HNH endonuclease signature motif containing protein n=1 Tax=Bradyrhizobium sp. AZCC 2289 TaxID=3117026 RepID=UPI003FA57AED